MHANRSLRLILTILIAVALSAFIGCAGTAEQEEPAAEAEAAQPAEPVEAEAARPAEPAAPAEAEAPAEEAKPDPAAQEALEQAEAAYDDDRWLTAYELYKKAAELGAEVPDSLLKKVEKRVKQQYEEAQAMLAEMAEQLADGEFDDAQETYAAIAETEVYQRDEAIRKPADDLKAKLEAARKQLAEDEGKTAKMLADAAAKIEAWDLAGAVALLDQVEKTQTYKREKAVRKQVASLRDDAEDAQEELAEQQEEVDEAIQEVRDAIAAWEFDDAQKCLDEAMQLGPYKTDKAVQEKIDPLKAELEAAKKKAEEERAQLPKLLADAEAKIGASDVEGAEAVVAQLEKLGLCAVEKSARKQVAAVRSKLQDAKEKLAEQQGEVGEALKAAEAKINDWNLDGARAELKAVKDSAVHAREKAVQDKVIALEAALAAAEKEIAKQSREVGQLIEQAQAKMEAGEVKAAADLLAQIKKMAIFEKDEDVRKSLAILSEKIDTAEARWADQRKEVTSLLAKAGKCTEKLNFPEAQEHILEASQKEVCKIDEALRKQIEAARAALDKAQKDLAAQQGEVGKAIADAEAKLAARDFDATFKALDELDKSPLVQRDDALGQKVAALRKDAKSISEDLGKQEKQVQDLLAKAKAKMQAWDFPAARQLIQQASQKEICKLKENLRKSVDEHTAALAAAEKGAAAQREEAAKLIKDAEAKLAAWKIQEAAAALAKVKPMEVLKHDEAMADKVEDLEDEAEDAEDDLADQGDEVASLLEDAAEEMEDWDFAAARQLIQQAEQKGICKIDDNVRKSVEDAKVKLDTAEKKVAQERQQVAAFLDQAGAKLGAADYAAARVLLQKAKATEVCARTKDIRRQIEDLEDKVAGAEKAAAGKAKQEASALYEQGLAAYEHKDYYNAKQLMEKAEAMKVSLGGRADRKLAKVLEQADGELKAGAAQYQEGLRLAKLGDYEQAKAVFVKLQESGAKCGPEIDDGLGAQLKGIDEKIRTQRLAQAAEREKALAEMEKARIEFLQGIKAKQQVLDDLDLAKAHFGADRLEEAKASLDSATALLAKLPVKEDPQLKKVLDEVQALTGQVDKALVEKKAYDAKVAKFQALLAEADKLRLTDMAAAEKKLMEALDYAGGEQLKLTAKQQDTVDAVKEAVEDSAGPEARARADRYWALVEQSEMYLAADDPEAAAVLLLVVQQGKDVPLGIKRRRELDGKLAAAKAAMADRSKVLQELDKHVAAAQASLKAGKGAEALTAYRDALKMAQTNHVGGAKLVGLLQKYQKAATALLPKVFQAQIDKIKQEAEATASAAVALQDYRMARFYVNAGSPDLAAPLLKKAAQDKAVGAEEQKWVASSLKGIDGSIKAMQERELLATGEVLENIFELEQKFQDAARAGDLKAATKLADQIDAARTKLTVAKAQIATDRGAYPVLAKLVQDSKDVIQKHQDNEALQNAVARVAQWQAEGDQVAAALAALKKRDRAALNKVLADLSADLPRDPNVDTVDALKSAHEALARASAAARDLENKQLQMLADIGAELSAAAARREAQMRYLKAVELYAAGKWTEVRPVLAQLGRSTGSLTSFEQEDVALMLKKTGAARPGPDLAAQRREAQKALAEAEAKIDEKQFDAAGRLLASVEGSAICRADKGVRQKAQALRSKLDEATSTVEPVEVDVTNAEQALVIIKQQVAARRFGKAAELLAELKKTDSYKADDAVRADVDELVTTITVAEAEAAELFEKAKAAYAAEDSAALRKLLDNLKANYRYTRTFAQHQ